jgi:nicotinamidase-related amidase
MQRLDPSQTAVIVVDVQEKLAAAMPEARMADVRRAATVLIEAARLLGATVIATEQYPAGLGPTIAPVAEALAAAGVPRLAKLAFSACGEDAFAAAWADRAPRAAVVIGMESHVCVFQTVRDLALRGVDTWVAADGVASRRDDHREVGLELCREAGAKVTTTESVVFDWLKRAGSDEFKRLSKLIR